MVTFLTGANAGRRVSVKDHRAGGELVFAAAVRIDSLDPQTVSFLFTRQILNNIFDPLVRQKPGDPKIYPGLATAWKVSDDKLSYTFTLRRDVKFHDGTPFNAAAVCFTFDRIVNPDMKSQLAFSLIGPYDSTTVVDAYTAKVKFKSPYAPFLDSVSQPFLSIISPTAGEKFGKDFGMNPTGTGPFKFESYQIDNVVRIVKNPEYNWAPSMFKHQGAPFINAMPALPAMRNIAAPRAWNSGVYA